MIEGLLHIGVINEKKKKKLQLLIAHKPAPEPDPKRARTQFLLHAGAFSYAQRAIVADSTSVITWYDYDKQAKCDPGDDLWAPILARMK